jgi:hypothetical protein
VSLRLLQLQLQFPALPVELQEEVDLALQNHRVQRLEQVVNCTYLIALEYVFVFLADGRDEDNRDVLGVLALTHQFGHLKPVHSRHLHIQQHQ